MSDYTKAIIYTITCLDTSVEHIYIGSTTNFNNRKSRHKSNCNNEKDKNYNYKLYQIIRENGGWDKFEMKVIEEYPCLDGIELKKREQYWIDLNENETVNMCRAYRTDEQYKEQIKQGGTLYRQNNVEKEKERMKIYYQNNKEDYKLYYQNNKDKINEKITCICGCIINKGKLNRHQKSQKHLILMNELILV
jgi:hypothetical protein